MHQRMAYVVNCHVPQKYSITAFLLRDFASKASFLRQLLRSSSSRLSRFWSSRSRGVARGEIFVRMFVSVAVCQVGRCRQSHSMTDPELEEEEVPDLHRTQKFKI